MANQNKEVTNMSVISDKISTVLQLKVNAGTDENGNDVTKVQSFRDIKIDAMDSDIYAVAKVLASLKSTPLVGVLRVDTYDLIEE